MKLKIRDDQDVELDVQTPLIYVEDRNEVVVGRAYALDLVSRLWEILSDPTHARASALVLGNVRSLPSHQVTNWKEAFDATSRLARGRKKRS